MMAQLNYLRIHESMAKDFTANQIRSKSHIFVILMGSPQENLSYSFRRLESFRAPIRPFWFEGPKVLKSGQL
jgi:hypothetical protein